MIVELLFKCRHVDSLVIPAGRKIHSGESFKLFDADYSDEEETITQKARKEEEIIKWLFNSEGKQLLLDELGVEPNSFISFSVTRPVIENTQTKPGDIDILICDGRRPEHSIAFQVKVVSVIAHNQTEDDTNKIQDIKDAVLQVNKQRDNLGFYKNYLVIIIKAYGRNRTQNNVLMRNPSPETFRRIYSFPQRESLHPDVGIIFIEINQPTGKSFNEMVKVCVCVDRPASILNQPDRLTNRIKEYMR